MSDRTLQDELLADLRQAAPVPDAPPRAERPAPEPDHTPALQIRVTPLRWSCPRVRAVREPHPTLELSAGPVRISLTR